MLHTSLRLRIRSSTSDIPAKLIPASRASGETCQFILLQTPAAGGDGRRRADRLRRRSRRTVLAQARAEGGGSRQDGRSLPALIRWASAPRLSACSLSHAATAGADHHQTVVPQLMQIVQYAEAIPRREARCINQHDIHRMAAVAARRLRRCAPHTPKPR